MDEIGDNAVETLYVDPLPGDAVLTSILSSNTTFLLGRKGTGKSTVFARAQSELRKRQDIISIYVDVKSLYDTLHASEVVANQPLECPAPKTRATRSAADILKMEN